MARTANATAQLFRWASLGILDHTDEQFMDRIDQTIAAVIERDGLVENAPGAEPELNLFGYGRLPVALSEPDDPTDGYFWGHLAAEILGWDRAEFDRWAHKEWQISVTDQRDMDVERNVIGWECIHYHPVGVSVWQGDGDSDAHADEGGITRGEILGYWVDLYLIHTNRIGAMMFDSPVKDEWYEAARPMLGWAMKESGLGEELNAVTASNGLPLGFALSDTDGLTRKQAIQQALRGPITAGADS